MKLQALYRMLSFLLKITAIVPRFDADSRRLTDYFLLDDLRSRLGNLPKQLLSDLLKICRQPSWVNSRGQTNIQVDIDLRVGGDLPPASKERVNLEHLQLLHTLNHS